MKDYNSKSVMILMAFFVLIALMLICLPFAYRNAPKPENVQTEQVEEVYDSDEQPESEETFNNDDVEPDENSDEESESAQVQEQESDTDFEG